MRQRANGQATACGWRNSLRIEMWRLMRNNAHQRAAWRQNIKRNGVMANNIALGA